MGFGKLDQHSAKATFALEKYRSIPIYFEKLIEKKHSVGNHTFDHLNGWKTTIMTTTPIFHCVKIRLKIILAESVV
jgi:hypothetical protein